MAERGSTTSLAARVEERALAPAQTGKTLSDELESLGPQIAAAVGQMVDPARFLRTAITETRRNADLLKCSRVSFLGAVMAAAQLGLEFGPQLGFAHLVPFNNKGTLECQLIIGYKGYINLSRRSGEIKNLVARPVYKEDVFDSWTDELGDHLIHRPCRDEEARGEIVRYYGLATYVNGGSYVEVMELGDIIKRAKRGRAYDSSYSPWKSDPIPMNQKTVIRKMVPFLPLRTEDAAGLAADEAQVRLVHGSAGDVSVDSRPFQPEPEGAIDAVSTDRPIETAGEQTQPLGGPADEEDAHMVAQTQAMVSALPEARLKELETQFVLPHNGGLDSRQDALVALLVEKRRAGDAAAEGLF